ncbi:unnamed protein product [Musa acuminata subsp. burmannicoides]
MEPVDLVPRGYRFLSTAEELVHYLANWIAGTPPGRAVAFADVYGTEPWNLLGSDRQEGYFCGAPAQGQRLLARRSNGRHRFWLLNRRQEPVKSIVDGREIVVGKKELPSFKDGRRKNSGWVMYEYEMCSSTFETRVLCHVKKSSYQPISGGKFMKSVESTFTEAATETLTGGSSFVGQKRNREESSTLISSTQEAMPGLVAHSNGAFQSDLSPPPTAVVQQLLLAPRRDNPGESSFLHRLRGTERSRSPSRHPSSTDVGGDVGITAEELEAFDLGKTAEELEAFFGFAFVVGRSWR